MTEGQNGTLSAFAVRQEVPSGHESRPHRIAIGLYDHREGRLYRRQRLELDVAGPLTSVPELTGVPLPDLILVNDDDLTFAKVRLDERSLRTLRDCVADFTDELPAALCLAAASTCAATPSCGPETTSNWYARPRPRSPTARCCGSFSARPPL